MTSLDTMKQALEALETEANIYIDNDPEDGPPESMGDAITNLKSAIAELESAEPVAWMSNDKSGGFWFQITTPHVSKEYKFTPLFTHPASNTGELDLLRTQVRELRLQRDELQKHFDAQCTSADVLFDKLAACQKERDAAYSKQAEMCNITAEQARQLVAMTKERDELLEICVGLSKGADWNNGTHAKIYRPKLIAKVFGMGEKL